MAISARWLVGLLSGLVAGLVSACTITPPSEPPASLSDPAMGAILVQVPPGPTGMTIGIKAYDDKTNQLVNRDGPSAGIRATGGMVLKVVRPGAYVIMSYAQQDHWAVCLHANTLAFDVKPGEITFLGFLDPTPQQRLLWNETGKRDQRKARFKDFFTMVDNVPPPAFYSYPSKDEQLAAAQAYVKQLLPDSAAPIRPAEFRPAHFALDHNLWGTPFCGKIW